MQALKTVGKREFIQHTSKYMKWVEENNAPMMITHRQSPEFILSKIKPKRFSDLRGIAHATILGDINETVLPGYDEWLS